RAAIENAAAVRLCIEISVLQCGPPVWPRHRGDEVCFCATAFPHMTGARPAPGTAARTSGTNTDVTRRKSRGSSVHFRGRKPGATGHPAVAPAKPRTDRKKNTAKQTVYVSTGFGKLM